MTGPLQQLLAMLMRKQPPQQSPQDRLIQQPGLQPANEYVNRPPMPFREPMQDTGPMPPMDPRILMTLMGK